MTGIPEGIVALILTAIGVVAWFGIKRIIEGQDEINTTLLAIAKELGAMKSEQASLHTWAQGHEKQDDNWQRNSEQSIRDLWAAVRKG